MGLYEQFKLIDQQSNIADVGQLVVGYVDVVPSTSFVALTRSLSDSVNKVSL